MSLIKRNIIANFIGNFWSAGMSFLFIPLYIHFLGIEAYGLIGVYVIIQTISSMLDMGIGTTINREMARSSVYPDKTRKMRDLLRTLEIIYWVIGFIIAVIIFLAAPYIAHKWVHGKQMPPVLIERMVIFMGIACALQTISGFYSGGLLGLQRQVLLNGINIFTSTLRSAGVIIVLMFLSTTIQAFFIWQIIVSFLQVYILLYSLWHSIPKNNLKAVFNPGLLKEIWHFSIGISGISIISLVLTQIDKIVLSRLLPLDLFGYYVLASTVAMGLCRFISPVSTAIYPRLAQLVVLNDQNKLSLFYHKFSQLMSVLILPCTIIVAFFSKEILFLWKQDPVTIQYAYKLLSILILGTAINGLMNIPYGLQLAFGWTKLTFYMDLIAMLILVPLIYFLVSFFGPAGAAFAWLIINTFCLFVGINIMHSRLLKDEKWHWWLNDVIKPLISIILVVFIGKFFININLSYLEILIYLVCLFFLSVFVSIAACSQLKNKIFGNLRFIYRMNPVLEEE